MLNKKNMILSAAIVAGMISCGLYLDKLIKERRGDISFNEDAPGKKYFPNFELTSHQGKKLKFFDDLLEDKIVLVNFIFTTCGSSCPLETARLKKVQNLLGEKFGKEIFFYSISIDPDLDSVEAMAEYHKRFGLKDDGWLLLKGEKEDIEKIQQKFGLYGGKLNKTNIQDHSLSVVIGNQRTGRWIKRSHLENPVILANLLESLNPKKTVSHFAKYDGAPTKMDPISSGENLFYSRCTDCHTIGNGNGIGPDLYNVFKKRDPVWINRWLKEPDKMLDEKDPLAMSLYNQYNKVPMPNLKLTDVDIAELKYFIEKESQNITDSRNKLKKSK